MFAWHAKANLVRVGSSFELAAMKPTSRSMCFIHGNKDQIPIRQIFLSQKAMASIASFPLLKVIVTLGFGNPMIIKRIGNGEFRDRLTAK
jgi:hypothetical protein